MNIKLTKVKLHFEAVHTPTLIHWIARGFHHVSLKLYELELIFLRKKNASLACLVSAQITILWGFALQCKNSGIFPLLPISIVFLWQICVFLVKEIVKVWETVVWCNIQCSLSQVTMSANFDDFYWKCTFLAEKYKLKVCEDFLFFFSHRMSEERKQISEHLKWGNLTSLSFRSYSETLHNIFKCYHVHQGFFL